MPKRVLRGVVVSDTADKTVAVESTRVTTHPKYHKIIRKKRRYLVHDPENQFTVGQAIAFIEHTPFSKRKSWLALGLQDKLEGAK